MALECLSRKRKDLIDNAIEKAKIVSRTLFKTVQNALDMKQIITAGPFIYYIIQDGCLDWYMFSHLHILSLLAHFILRSFVVMSRNRRAATLPLIVSTPKNSEMGTCLLLGIPPLCEDSPNKYVNYGLNSTYLLKNYFVVFSGRLLNKLVIKSTVRRTTAILIHLVSSKSFQLYFFKS